MSSSPQSASALSSLNSSTSPGSRTHSNSLASSYKLFHPIVYVHKAAVDPGGCDSDLSALRVGVNLLSKRQNLLAAISQ
ncbi:hypothetical protein TSMEX_001064 [Taenia solium]|eukprot:TsM_000761400 transcript=TsM_000761400 gene=TsM_000761400